MWPLLQDPPQGLTVDFVKAEHSTFRQVYLRLRLVLALYVGDAAQAMHRGGF